MLALEIKNLSVQYEEGIVLEEVSFSVEHGAFIAVIGPNGAGKSTLMKAIMELIPVGTFSHIHVDRARLGYIPQHQSIDWTFPVTVRDAVMMGLARQVGWLRWPTKNHWARVHQALERVELDAFSNRQIGELSGGQRQRVFIARSLAQQNDILLLDEPFAGVDVAAQSSLMQVISRLNREEALTILLTTHDMNLAFQRFDQIMAINRRLIAFGTPQEVYTAQTLRSLYGAAVAILPDADSGQVMVFVDEDRHS